MNISDSKLSKSLVSTITSDDITESIKSFNDMNSQQQGVTGRKIGFTSSDEE